MLRQLSFFFLGVESYLETWDIDSLFLERLFVINLSYLLCITYFYFSSIISCSFLAPVGVVDFSLPLLEFFPEIGVLLRPLVDL